jgi:uncharacterized protein with HEPN domain
MIRNISLYIKDILQNMRDAGEFIQGFSYGQFVADKRTFNAVVRSLEVIGEAAKNVPDEIRAKNPWFPGRKWWV